MELPARHPFKLEVGWLRDQAFRWTERAGERDGWLYGVVGGHAIKVRNSEAGIEFRSNVPEESIRSHVEHYFRLDENIEPVHAALREVDAKMATLVEKHGGMRLLRQDPWECLVAYICSQNNSVEGIAAIVGQLADKYGEDQALDDVQLNAFPSAQRLFEVGADALGSLRLGLGRGRLIWTVGRDVTDGFLDLDDLIHRSHEQARGRLMSYRGIGPKIADCVCLFSLDKPEAFPVDTNIGAALKQYYGKTYTPGGQNVRLIEWARDRFGDHAGYAGQLLFYDRS